MRSPGRPLSYTLNAVRLTPLDDSGHPFDFSPGRLITIPSDAEFTMTFMPESITWPVVEMMFDLPRPKFSGPWRLSGGSWYRSGVYASGPLQHGNPFERRVDLA